MTVEEKAAKMVPPEAKARSACWNDYCITHCVKWYTCDDQDNCISVKQMYNEQLEKFKKEAEENDNNL